MSNHSRRRFMQSAALTAAAGTALAPSSGSTVAASSVGDDSRTTDSSDWSSLGGNPGNNAYVPDDPGPSAPVEVAWQYEVCGGPIAIVDGTIYLTSQGEVHAVDAVDGSAEWTTHDISAAGTPAMMNDTLYVGGDRLTRIDPENGDILGQADLGYDEAIPSPTVVNGHVYVVADDVLYALDAEAEERWRFESDADPLFEQPVAVGDDAVFAVSESELYALELEDGTVRWTDDEPAGESDDVDFMEPTDRHLSYPVATDDVVAVASVDWEKSGIEPVGHISLYETSTGEKRTVSETPPWVAGSVADDRYYGYDGYNLRGFDRETGSEEWDTEVATYKITSAIAAEGTVYGSLLTRGEAYDPDERPDPDRGIYAFDEETGETEWAIPMSGYPDLALVDGTLYASNDDGVVAVRSASDGDESDGIEDDAETDGDTADGDGSDDGNDSNGGNDENGGNDGNDGSDRNDGNDGNDEDDDSNGSETTSTDENTGSITEEVDDPSPGFTGLAGVVGGGLSLEWLRRQADGRDAEE